MSCAYLRFAPPDKREEWVPMGLRNPFCLRRATDPQLWAAELRRLGIEVDEDDRYCLQNLDGTWEKCPFYHPRKKDGGDGADG